MNNLPEAIIGRLIRTSSKMGYGSNAGDCGQGKG